MKKLLCLAFITGTLRLSAQQLPEYTQYNFNELLINPAVTGIESYLDVKSGYRSQWSGLQGAPTTTFLTFSIPIDRSFTQDDYSQMIRNVDNPIGRADAESYRASANHSGLGFSLISDKTAQIQQTHLDASYAYHLETGSNYNIAVGASVGLNNLSLNTAAVTTTVALDPAISQGNNSQWKPEASVGIWVYGARFFVGASALQLIPATISFSANQAVYNQGQTYAQYFVTAGYRFYVSDDVTALPSVVVRPFEKNGPTTFDINTRFAFRDIFWVGGAYRKDDAISASFGFNIGALLTIGYSYDYTTSDLNSVSYGTNEIHLGVLLNNHYNVTTPRHTW